MSSDKFQRERIFNDTKQSRAKSWFLLMLIINSCCVFDVCFLHEIQQVTDWYMLLELARLLLVAFHTVVTALKSDSKVKGLFHLIKSLRRGHRVTCVYHVVRAPCLYLLITSSSLQPPLQPTFPPTSNSFSIHVILFQCMIETYFLSDSPDTMFSNIFCHVILSL